MKLRSTACLLIVFILCCTMAVSHDHSSSFDRETQAQRNTAPVLAEYWGKPVFIRIIKEEFVLEMWLRMADHWMLFKTYPIAGMSGDLVPKEREGDCLQVYPFRMTAERMEADSPHLATWRHLLPGWQYTEKVQAPYPDTDN